MVNLPPEIWVQIIESIPEYWDTDLYMVNTLFMEMVFRTKYYNVHLFQSKAEINDTRSGYLRHLR
jgi:hypothetical protein